MRNEKGVRAEWELRAKLKEQGAIVVRGAGSHAVDLLAIWSSCVWAIEVKSTSKPVLRLNGAYLIEQLSGMFTIAERIPSFYAVRFGNEWAWYHVHENMSLTLRPEEGMTLEQARGYS